MAIRYFTNDEITERYIKLPDDIAAVFDDPKTEDIVAAVCRDHHLEDIQKILIVEQLTAYVLLGFVHDYDLGREIVGALGLTAPQLGADLANAISAKIFAPIKISLAQVYKPAPAVAPPEEDLDGTDEGASPATELPRPVQELKPPTAPTPDRPSFLSMAASAASLPKVPAASGPTQTTPLAAPAATGPAPFMLHTLSEFQPVKSTGNLNLNLNKATATTSSSTFANTPSRPTPTPAAHVEIGSLMEAVKRPTSSRTEAAVPHVVHYSELKTTAPAFGSALPPAAPPSGLGTTPTSSTSVTQINQAPHIPTPAAPLPSNVPIPTILPSAPVQPVAPTTPPPATPVAPQAPIIVRPELPATPTPAAPVVPIIPAVPVGIPAGTAASSNIAPPTIQPITPATPPPVAPIVPKLINYTESPTPASTESKGDSMLTLPN